MFKKIIYDVVNIFYYLLPNYPRSRYIYQLFETIRFKYHKIIFKKFGEGSVLRKNVQFIKPQNISIGSNCTVGEGSKLNGLGKIQIGNDFLGGPDLIIYTAEHGLKNNGTAYRLQDSTLKEVVIGTNVYIGAKVIILSGTNIGDNCVIGAGSIVGKDVPNNELWAGIPAKKIKDIK